MSSYYCLTAAILVVFGSHSADCDFHYKRTYRNLEIYLDNRLVIQHTTEHPAIFIGHGKARYDNDLGNFKINDDLDRKLPLPEFIVSDEPTFVDVDDDDEAKEDELGQSPFRVRFMYGKSWIVLEFVSTPHINTIRIADAEKGWNRLWLRLSAEKEEHVYGGGEQFSHFSLRGRSYPMWVREQGVGRNISTTVTYLAEIIAGAGGDYHTTYWPQATFVSERMYFAHLDHSYYSSLNFKSDDFLELELWEDFSQAELHLGTATSWPLLLENLTAFLGRQPMPPSWLYNGAIIGLQGGTDKVLSRYEALKKQEVQISAIWIQDWSGKMMTSLGKRVYWNWSWNEEMYPNLDIIMKNFKDKENVRFLSYINPHVINGSEMFKYADENGYFITNARTGDTLLIEFGEMPCGSVDLTNPDAYAWYKDVVKSMLDLGFSGWMADFGGEYLPVDDAVYHDGRSSAEMHNVYSEIWARLNKEVVEEMGKLDDTFIFMRSGFGKSPGYTLMSWAGDQNVDFSYGDGLASVIPAALSLGMSGMGLHHSDIGGYVSLICMVRTEELVLRWGEMSVFTPVMRTHEGNRPTKNWQVYTSNKTTQSFARLTRLYTQLSPYHTHVAKENAEHGYPAQRPLFFHYPDDPEAYDIQYQYLYGSDLLVAPVLFEDRRQWAVYLPSDEWVYLWNGSDVVVEADKDGRGGSVTVNAEMGYPPVFYRRKTEWATLFQKFSSYAVGQHIQPEGPSWNLLWEEPLIFLYLLLRKLFWYVFFNV